MALSTRKIKAALLALLLAMPSAYCQTSEHPEGNDDEIKVSFITCHAGSSVYELCGHSAIRIRIGDKTAVAVNYGMFDFDAPNFIYRFVKGETDYFVAAMPTWRFLQQYRTQGRRVVEQRLRMTQEQAARLVELIRINLLPENRTYRYNYVLDNCATRPLAIIEKALGQQIIFNDTLQAPTTFRKEMKRYHKNYPWYQFGIDLALGNGIDRPITFRERGFAPETLEGMLSEATISDSQGNQARIVTETAVLNEGRQGGAQLPPTPPLATPMFIFILLLAATLLITFFDIRRKKASRWLDSLIFGCLGIAGLVMTFLIFVSVHEATSPNYLYIWINPLCLIAAVGIWLKKWKPLLIYYHFANFAALILTCIVWKAASQACNAAMIPLMLCDMARSATYIYLSKCTRKRTD